MMIRNLAALRVSPEQSNVFRNYRPVAKQNENMTCHLESFDRYLSRVKKSEETLIAKENKSAMLSSNASAEPVIIPVRQGLLDVFLSKQSRPKTLNAVLSFFRLRGHTYNNEAAVPDMDYGKSKPVVIRVIRDALMKLAASNNNPEKRAIFIFTEICAYLGIKNNVNNVDAKKIANQPNKVKRSFRAVLNSLPDVEACRKIITTLEWDPDISFPFK